MSSKVANRPKSGNRGNEPRGEDRLSFFVAGEPQIKTTSSDIWDGLKELWKEMDIMAHHIRRILSMGVISISAVVAVACGPGTAAAPPPQALGQTEIVEATALPDLQTEEPMASMEIPEELAATPARPQIHTEIASTQDGLMIDEDPYRGPLFHINTLAYELPGMDEVEVVNITYAYREDQPLTMDVYYPPGTPADARLPVVIFGLGYRMSKQPLRNAHFYTSWGRLVAAAGMAGIAYDTEQPDQDLEVLMAFIRQNWAALRIDPGRIGFHSTSANPPTVMSYLMQEGRQGIRFAVYYYGHSLTPDRKYAEGFDQSCSTRGCLMGELADVTYVDPKVPLLIVKAGKDFVPDSNEAMDHFVEYVRQGGTSVTVIEYEEGVHGFDTQQKTQESAEIIADTVAFMRANFGVGP